MVSAGPLAWSELEQTKLDLQGFIFPKTPVSVPLRLATHPLSIKSSQRHSARAAAMSSGQSAT
jgi:hypothetical protein